MAFFIIYFSIIFLQIVCDFYRKKKVERKKKQKILSDFSGIGFCLNWAIYRYYFPFAGIFFFLYAPFIINPDHLSMDSHPKMLRRFFKYLLVVCDYSYFLFILQHKSVSVCTLTHFMWEKERLAHRKKIENRFVFEREICHNKRILIQ